MIVENVLEGKKVLVTGGTSGIGRSIAVLFVSQGADVMIFGTSETGAKESLAEPNGPLTDAVEESFEKSIRSTVDTAG